jgi:hypothetical protein
MAPRDYLLIITYSGSKIKAFLAYSDNRHDLTGICVYVIVAK